MSTSTSSVRRGARYQRRRTGIVREVIGFTTKPDGIRRARLADSTGSETRVRVDQILKTYEPYAA